MVLRAVRQAFGCLLLLALTLTVQAARIPRLREKFREVKRCAAAARFPAACDMTTVCIDLLQQKSDS